MARSLRTIASGLLYSRTVAYYLRVIYGKINPWLIVRKFASGATDRCECLRVVANCNELHTDTSELFTDAFDRLRIGDP